MTLPRLSVRRAMIAVAILALLLGIAVEFRDGSPPRFVVRGIPARVARLKPGMNWQEVHDILGLETSWLKGGTSARSFIGEGKGWYHSQSYAVGTPRLAMIPSKASGGRSLEISSGCRGMIDLRFDTSVRTFIPPPDDPLAGIGAWRKDKATRLTEAIFTYDGKALAVMPGGQ